MLLHEQSSPGHRLRAPQGTVTRKQSQTSLRPHSSPWGLSPLLLFRPHIPGFISLTLHSKHLDQLTAPCHTGIPSNFCPCCSFCLECPLQAPLPCLQTWILPISQGAALMTPPPGSRPPFSACTPVSSPPPLLVGTEPLQRNVRFLKKVCCHLFFPSLQPFF